MKNLLFTCLIFNFCVLFSQEDKTYKNFDPKKTEIWKQVSEVNDYHKQQYVVNTEDSLATIIDKNVAQARIFFSGGFIKKMEITLQNKERYDFLWKEKNPLLIAKYHTGTTQYDIQYYFYEGKLYETKNPKKMAIESEEALIKKANYFHALGYSLLKNKR